jgi:hypothetical protein
MSSQQSLRLARSLIAQPSDRFVPVSHAADALLAALIELPGKLPSKVQNRLDSMVRDEVSRMTEDGVIGCEVVNYFHHRGIIYSVGLYQTDLPTADPRGQFVRFSVGFGGGIFRNVARVTYRDFGVSRPAKKGGGR